MKDLHFKPRSWWGRAWDLTDGDHTVGSLVLKSIWSSQVEARYGRAIWQLGFKNWSRSRVFAKSASGAALAEVVPRSWLGTTADLTLGGMHYTLKQDAWQNTLMAVDDGGAEVMRIEPRMWKGGVKIITTRSLDDENMALLAHILFYCYQFIVLQTGVAASTAVIVASTAS